MLPTHKMDQFFDGNTVLLETWQGALCPVKPFITYLAARDALYPLHPQLQLTAASTSPTYS